MSDGKKKRGLAITARDIALLQSLSTARYLTVEALEWLHFPGWRERYAAYMEQIGQGKEARYQPSTLLYSRMRRLAEFGIVHRISRPVARAWNTFKRAPDLFALSQAGADLVAAQGIPYEALHYERPRARSFQTLEHAEGIGQLYAALRAKVESRPGLELRDWQGDHLLAKAYDRVEARVKSESGGTKYARLALIPDGTCVIVAPNQAPIRLFVEVDRGRSIASWRQKVATYKAYARSRQLRERYQAERFTVLVVTTTPTQRQRLIEATAQVLEGNNPHFLFTLEDSVHPLTIGSSWHCIDQVTVTNRDVGRNRMVWYEPTIKEHIFIY